MNILFDIGHPAHVHLFRHFIRHLRDNGHNPVTVTRDKDVTHRLLEHYGIEYKCLSAAATNLPAMLWELAARDTGILALHRQTPFDFGFGTSVSIGHVSRITRMKSIVFSEDDDNAIPLQAWISYPFSDTICVPDCLRYKRWGAKRLKHNSYHELAYLHPNHFTPDPAVPAKYGLTPGKYAIARFCTLKANHDINAKGISTELWAEIAKLLDGLDIIKSIEADKSHRIDPWDMHHILAFAKMIVSDSQTMTVEAACLGVPAVRINTFVDHSTVIEELEKKYRLALGFHPEDGRRAVETVKELVLSETAAEWRIRRGNLLGDKRDLNQWMIDRFERNEFQCQH